MIDTYDLMSVSLPNFTIHKINPSSFQFLIFMETKRGILFSSFMNKTHLLTITFGLSAYNFNVRKTLYSHINLEELTTLYSNVSKYIRHYIQLYLKTYLSDVYSEHFFFFYNIFFTKFKMILLIL